MTSTRSSRKPPHTYFEQVPLETVKQLVPVDPDEQKPEHFHAVQFYDSPDALCRIVGTFISEGLEQGAAAVLIVTPDHALRIEACLRSGAIDVESLKRSGALVIFDARETLNRFMVDGMPNPSAFRRADCQYA